MLKRQSQEAVMLDSQQTTKYVHVDYDHCSYCGACVPICPPASIVLHDATLLIDQNTCTRCERCITVCPTGALTWSMTDEA